MVRAKSASDSRTPRPTSHPGRNKLEPPSWITPDSKLTRVRREGFSKIRATILPRSEAALRAELRQCLEIAVRRRLCGGETIGAALSGGIDSSLVVALARQQAPVKTFSISFGQGYANELAFSSLVAEHCQSQHYILELSPAAILHYLDETIA